MDERPEGFPERLHGKHSGGGPHPRWSLRHWTRTAGKTSVSCIIVYIVEPIGLTVVVLPQGILLEHREMEFGDKVNIEDVIRAARRISQEPAPLQRR